MKQIYVAFRDDGTVIATAPPPDGYSGPYDVPDDFVGNQFLYRLVDGEIVLDDDLVAAHEAESLTIAALNKRDELLQACAYARVMRAAMPQALRAAWDDYEAALNAITEQEGYPRSIDWPVAPGVRVWSESE